MLNSAERLCLAQAAGAAAALYAVGDGVPVACPIPLQGADGTDTGATCCATALVHELPAATYSGALRYLSCLHGHRRLISEELANVCAAGQFPPPGTSAGVGLVTWSGWAVHVTIGGLPLSAADKVQALQVKLKNVLHPYVGTQVGPLTAQSIIMQVKAVLAAAGVYKFTVDHVFDSASKQLKLQVGVYVSKGAEGAQFELSSAGDVLPSPAVKGASEAPGICVTSTHHDFSLWPAGHHIATIAGQFNAAALALQQADPLFGGKFRQWFEGRFGGEVVEMKVVLDQPAVQDYSWGLASPNAYSSGPQSLGFSIRLVVKNKALVAAMLNPALGLIPLDLLPTEAGMCDSPP